MKNLHTFITPMGLLPWILALELDRVPVVNSISCIRQTKAFRVLARLVYRSIRASAPLPQTV